MSGIISKAIESGNPDLYVNHTQFMVSSSEVFIDLNYISPVIGESGNIKAALKQRIIIPHSLVKGFVDGLSRVKEDYDLAAFSKASDISESQSTDTIDIRK